MQSHITMPKASILSALAAAYDTMGMFGSEDENEFFDRYKEKCVPHLSEEVKNDS